MLPLVQARAAGPVILICVYRAPASCHGKIAGELVGGRTGCRLPHPGRKRPPSAAFSSEETTSYSPEADR